jgi:hypothetical protein
MVPRSVVLVALGLVGTVGCAQVEPVALGVCTQTGEFGSYGCVAFAGIVRDSGGQPYAGVSVGLRPGADALQFNVVYATTQSDGRFAFQLTRFLPGPDSVSLYIGAAVIPTPPETVVTIGSTILVRGRVAPVGAVPDTVVLQFVLPRPGAGSAGRVSN